MNIQPVKDTIIFEFLDTITNGAFASKTRSGIILNSKNSEDNAQTPRWGRVYAIGPEVQDVKVNDFVLIAPLRWTLGFKFNDTELSRTIEKEILCVADDVSDLTQLFL